MKLPDAFINKYQHLLGDEAPAFLTSFDQPATGGFRVNPAKAAPTATLDRATGKVEYVPTGYRERWMASRSTMLPGQYTARNRLPCTSARWLLPNQASEFLTFVRPLVARRPTWSLR